VTPSLAGIGAATPVPVYLHGDSRSPKTVQVFAISVNQFRQKVHHLGVWGDNGDAGVEASRLAIPHLNF
jgi:hypothetical protein